MASLKKTNSLLKLDDKEREFKLRKLELSNEKFFINSSQRWNFHLSIKGSLQLIISCTYEAAEIEKWDEFTLTKNYHFALMKIIEQAKKTKSAIKIEVGPYKVSDHAYFLEEVQKIKFREIFNLKDWHEFMNSLSDYSLHSRYIRLLMKQMGFSISDIDIENMRMNRVHQGREKIYQIFSSLTKAEIEFALQATHGKRGLKSLVRSKISNIEFNKLFPMKHDFSNRWKEVRDTLKLEKN